MEWLVRTRNFYEECRAHLDETSSRGTEVEAFLAQYLLVALCAEMQDEIYRVVEIRTAQCGDSELCGFALNTSKRILRSVKIAELLGFVGHFGPERKQRFSEALDERVRMQYDTAVSNRHAVAHRNGAQVTIADLAGIIDSAERVLDSAHEALID